MLNHPLNTFPETHPASRAGRARYRLSLWRRVLTIAGYALACAAAATVVWACMVAIMLTVAGP